MKASDCSKKRDRSAIMESEKAAAYGATTVPSKGKGRFFKWNESAAEEGATTVPRGKGGKPTNVDASEALSDITDVSGDWSSSGDETRRSLRLQEELLEAALDDPSKDTDLACVKKEEESTVSVIELERNRKVLPIDLMHRLKACLQSPTRIRSLENGLKVLSRVSCR